MTRSPLRLAILECDTPIGRTKEKYGGYGNLFKKLLNEGADKVAEQDGTPRPELDITKYDVVNHELYPKLEEVDAVLLTGSSESFPPYTHPGGTFQADRHYGRWLIERVLIWG
jgi:hypothetical protein